MANGKRGDYPDSKIMDALDAANYSIRKAAERLGVCEATLYRWIKDSANLSKYLNLKLETDALKAREKLNDILDKLDFNDSKFTGHVISVCKILLDKVEADKQEMHMTQETTIDQDLEEKVRRLLDMTREQES